MGSASARLAHLLERFRADRASREGESNQKRNLSKKRNQGTQKVAISLDGCHKWL